jgi:ABC-type lipoprotein release transport system permease subunit
LLQDLTFAIRTLRRDPGYAATAVLTLAVIGLTFIAILVPARRASMAEPSAILRQE